jgi:hypothetical protein
MFKKLVVVTAMIGAFISGGFSTDATDAVGPVCFVTVPFVTVWVWHIDSYNTSPTLFFVGSGVQSFGGIQHLSGYINSTQTEAYLGVWMGPSFIPPSYFVPYNPHAFPLPIGPIYASVELDLSNLSGTGTYYSFVDSGNPLNGQQFQLIYDADC